MLARHWQQRATHVKWCDTRRQDPGDEPILAIAHAEARVLVTLDKDFGELAVVWGLPHHGIIQLVSIRARYQGVYCCHLLSAYGDQLQDGALVTASEKNVRIRPAQDEPGG